MAGRVRLENPPLFFMRPLKRPDEAMTRALSAFGIGCCIEHGPHTSKELHRRIDVETQADTSIPVCVVRPHQQLVGPGRERETAKAVGVVVQPTVVIYVRVSLQTDTGIVELERVEEVTGVREEDLRLADDVSNERALFERRHRSELVQIAGRGGLVARGVGTHVSRMIAATVRRLRPACDGQRGVH